MKDMTVTDAKPGVRHAHTNYDRMLAKGHERGEARAAVAAATADVLERWSRPAPA